MPQFAAFSINDGATTPVSVSYALRNIGNGVVQLQDRRLALQAAMPSIVLGFNAPSRARPKSTKITRDFTLPHQRTVNGVDAVVGTSRAAVVFYIDESATAQEIKHLEAMVQNSGANAMVQSSLRNVEPIYGS